MPPRPPGRTFDHSSTKPSGIAYSSKCTDALLLYRSSALRTMQHFWRGMALSTYYVCEERLVIHHVCGACILTSCKYAATQVLWHALSNVRIASCD